MNLRSGTPAIGEVLRGFSHRIPGVYPGALAAIGFTALLAGCGANGEARTTEPGVPDTAGVTQTDGNPTDLTTVAPAEQGTSGGAAGAALENADQSGQSDTDTADISESSQDTVSNPDESEFGRPVPSDPEQGAQGQEREVTIYRKWQCSEPDETLEATYDPHGLDINGIHLGGDPDAGVLTVRCIDPEGNPKAAPIAGNYETEYWEFTDPGSGIVMTVCVTTSNLPADVAPIELLPDCFSDQSAYTPEASHVATVPGSKFTEVGVFVPE